MTSKSTSIGDLPNVASNGEGDEQETLMVNSILQEIENDDDIDTSENTLNYAMDTSQIPPKIHEQMPTREIIEETTKELFRNPIIHEPVKIETPINVSNNLMEDNISDMEVNKKEVTGLLSKDKNVEPLTDKIIKISKYAGIILVLFVILTLPQLNKLILKFLPKMTVEGPQVSVLCNLLKGVLLALIYFGLSFVL
jgi:hypothetical protein